MRTSAQTTAGRSFPARDAGALAALVGLLAAAVLVAAGPAAAAAARTPPPSWSVAVVQTSANLAQRLTQLPDLRFRKWQPRRMPVIDVDDTIGYQPITGIGAALTDSAAWLIHDQLSSRSERKLIAQLFGFTGIRLSFLRVPIGASDYDLDNRPYSYDEMPPGRSDPSLRHFSIGHDLAYILPTLRAALRKNRRIELLANPWSPPAWMKANDSLENLHALGALRPSAYEPLARYFVKFIKAYARRGVRIDAITPQNEPSSGRLGAAYPGMTLPARDEARFIARDLQPALTAAHLHVKIYGNDLSWSDARDYAAPVARADTRELTGISWHCYFGSPTVMTALHRRDPELDQIADECSPEIRTFGLPEYLISSLRNWASAVAVWNLALDPFGGPKLTTNGCVGCTGVVTIDERTHTATLGRTYYQLGQVSAFLRPGARRIASRNFVSDGVNRSNIEAIRPGLDDVAFLNTNGNRVLVAYDNSSAPIHFAVAWRRRAFEYRLSPGTLVTFLWNPTSRHPVR